ncbi:MAG: hypothetical protein H6722_22475 [Sandaracinus sp.]|nr:hypothetical protein [Sandaracinus sp.]
MLRAALVLAFLALTTPALADTGEAGVQAGVLRLEGPGGTRLEPTLRSDFAFELVGPLHAGGWVQVVGLTLPLTEIALGGGVEVSLRPQLGWFRPTFEVAGGRQRLPTARQDGREVGTWTTSAAVGLGVAATEQLVIEARLTHAWFHQLDADLDDHAWLATVGLGVRIP